LDENALAPFRHAALSISKHCTCGAENPAFGQGRIAQARFEA
jgi:hypothetical protein